MFVERLSACSKLTIFQSVAPALNGESRLSLKKMNKAGPSNEILLNVVLSSASVPAG